MKFKTEVIRKEIDNCQLPGPEVALQMCDKIDRMTLLLKEIVGIKVLSPEDLLERVLLELT
jgi:hypothetical protein